MHERIIIENEQGQFAIPYRRARVVVQDNEVMIYAELGELRGDEPTLNVTDMRTREQGPTIFDQTEEKQ